MTRHDIPSCRSPTRVDVVRAWKNEIAPALRHDPQLGQLGNLAREEFFGAQSQFAAAQHIVLTENLE